MKIVAEFANVEIEFNPQPKEFVDPVTGEKSINYWGKVMTMGDSFNARNPKKLSGPFKSLKVEAIIDSGAKNYRDKSSGFVSASIVRTVRFGVIIEAIPAK
ncbi:MAG: hypothetical protein WC378_11435 [Opitutaceae bacterium]|jgi:hypothetical protein